MSAPVDRAIGTAPNVDLSSIDQQTPFETDTKARRIIGCECITCGMSDVVLAEPGRTHEWEHARAEPTHTIEYWRRDKR